MLFCLLIRGVTLEGASDGIKYYLLPDISKLTTSQVRFPVLSSLSINGYVQRKF